MYQVVKMYGDNEPWWFFEDWQSDITESYSFQSLEDAIDCYRKLWLQLRPEYNYMNAKNNFLVAFWNDGDERWCEECDDDLQQYIGLALLKDFQAVTAESGAELYETANSSGKAKCCKGFKQGAWS